MLLAEAADRGWCKTGEYDDEDEGLNALCVAAKEGHREVVKEMFSYDDAHMDGTMAIKAIMFAAGSGHEDVVELLFEKVPIEVLRASSEVSGAVVEAVRNGHQGIVERLLTAGLDVDLEVDGYTPLQAACMYGMRDMTGYLLTAGADVNKGSGLMKRNPLYCASLRGHKAVVELLLGAGAEVDKRDIHGNTPLMGASTEGHKDVVKLLLGAGAEVDKTNKNGQSPLYASIWRGYREVVELLLDAGPDVDARDENGYTPLVIASIEGRNDVVKLLLDRGAEVDKGDNVGRTPLFYAWRSDRTDVVRLLLDAGADLEREVNRYPGATRLHWASKIGLLDMVRSLLDAGADVNRKDHIEQQTPLHWAAEGRNDCSAVAELLLSFGAEVDKEDNDGFTPLLLAAERGNSKVCSVLLMAGADIDHAVDDEDGSTAIRCAVNNEAGDTALLLMQWEPSLTDLRDGEAEALEVWLSDDLKAKEAILQEKESEMDNLNCGIEEWCNAAAAASSKKQRKSQKQQEN